jgi:hypothetical protein
MTRSWGRAHKRFFGLRNSYFGRFAPVQAVSMKVRVVF